METKLKLRAALKAARDLAEKARAEGRELTAAESRALEGHLAEAKSLRAIVASDETYAALAEIEGGEDTPDGAKGRTALSFKGLSRAIRSKHEGNLQVKALLSSGSTATTAETVTPPVALGQPASGLLDLLPVRFLEGTDQYSYLRQITRTNNAAPVAPGGTKPTSVYTLERISRTLQVIAHLSEPIPEFWLSDSSDLARFLDSEMGYGLRVALEDQVLNGDGEDPNLEGILSVSGIQTVAFGTSAILTVRSGITALEGLGYTPSGLVMTPESWEAIETVSVDEAHYALGQTIPVDRAARKLWGVPVALSVAATDDKAVLVSEGSVGLVADRTIYSTLGRVGDDFSKNLVRARVEGRFGVEVYQPLGIAEIALEADEG